MINKDFVHPGRGFPTHSHRDMEIITYILEGALEYCDSMGNGSVIRPGDVQRMTAGTGVSHSESNAEPDKPVHLLQIWILPRQSRLKPGYEQKFFTREEKQGQLRLIASEDGRDGLVTVQQDVKVYAAVLADGQEVVDQLAPNRHAWIQVARGVVTIDGEKLEQGVGGGVRGESSVKIVGREPAEVLVFDLA